MKTNTLLDKLIQSGIYIKTKIKTEHAFKEHKQKSLNTLFRNGKKKEVKSQSKKQN